MSQIPCGRTRAFFEEGTPEQFHWVLGMYDKCLRLKAESKSKKPDNIVTLDKWYQNELPKKIKSRGKDPHLTHEELVQTIKWKLARGKFRPNLVNLVQMNTPRVVMQETKKAFRNIFKREDLQSGLTAMCNLKGVGPAMASAVLAAGAPHMAPFMADEVLLALPEVDCLDYTMKEYMRMTEHVNTCVERLNSQQDGGEEWTPHKVELAVWTHYIANELKPELLEEKPSSNPSSKSAPVAENGSAAAEETSDKAEEPKAEEAKEEDKEAAAAPAAENGASNGSSSAHHENGKSKEAPSENGTADEKTNGDSTAAPAVDAASPPPATAVPAESDENTNDSTKENKESPSPQSAQKRPHEEGSNGSAAQAANAETEAAVAGEGEDEPAAKKLKEQQQQQAETAAAAPPAPVAAEALTTA